jgi:hypothetical protein
MAKNKDFWEVDAWRLKGPQDAWLWLHGVLMIV